MKKEIEKMTEKSPKKINVAMMARLSNEKINLSKPVEFYKEIATFLGDDGNFIENRKDTSVPRISIEVAADITLWIGRIAFMQLEDVHEAIWAFMMAHEIFKVKHDDRSNKLAIFLNAIHDWGLNLPSPKSARLTQLIKKITLL